LKKWSGEEALDSRSSGVGVAEDYSAAPLLLTIFRRAADAALVLFNCFVAFFMLS